MDKIQIDHLNMFETVDECFKRNAASWNSNSKMNLAVKDFHNNINEINKLSTVQQGSSTVGITKSKLEAKENMAELAAAAISAGKAYAHEIKDAELFKSLNVNKSKIINAAGNKAGYMTQLIHDILLPLTMDPDQAANLSDCGIDTDGLKILQKAIYDYISLLGKPLQKATTRILATRSLAKYFSDTIDLLNNRLDPLMVQYKIKKPEFFKLYTLDRFIHVIGHRKTVIISGFVFNNETPALPQPHVLMKLTGKDKTGNKINLSKHTDAKGHYSFTRLHIGTYTVSFSLSGFKTDSKTCSVTEAQVIKTDFVMVKS